MTENAIVTTNNKIDSTTIVRAREFASRLKYMIVNGNKLEDKEVYALAHYAAANNLNPFAQECYYLPGTGPITGIVGYRRKADEALLDECHNFGINEPQHFWTETRQATQDEAVFDPDKDIAVFVTLRDSITNKTWRRSYFETVRELRELGEKDFFEVAKQFVGPEPVWTGVGVVQGSENFGQKERFDRHERAAKRGE
ncbi:MAG: recombinase RecT, partial [Syntrophales bacterium]|nr:recombinase RecT [Syntrophales bacterium]